MREVMPSSVLPDTSRDPEVVDPSEVDVDEVEGPEEVTEGLGPRSSANSATQRGSQLQSTSPITQDTG